MAKTQSKISQSEMALTINLEETFGTAITSPSLRQEIGQAFINAIIDRTSDGKSLSGGNFRGYSKAYKESLSYKVGRKTGEVNLRLTGDMLETMNITDDTENKITIGWQSDTQNAKAFNHHTGDTLPARPFFGLQKSELDEIAEGFSRKVGISNRLGEAKSEDEFRRTAVEEIKRILSGE